MWFLTDWRSCSARRPGSCKRVSGAWLSTHSCWLEVLECRTLLSIGTTLPLPNTLPTVANDNDMLVAVPAAYSAAAALVQTSTTNVQAVNPVSASNGGDGVAIQVAANQIHITATWLAQQGPGPYLLTSSNETYVLDTNVTVNGTAFVVGGANITLDLNGHTVTYGNAGSPTVTNGGFETGNIGDNYLTPVLGWDLTGAHGTAIAANPTVYGTPILLGTKCLGIVNFSTAQTIISDAISIPEANHTYSAVILPYVTAGTVSVQISILDAATGTVIKAGDVQNINYGSINAEYFIPTTTNPVKLKFVITPSGARRSIWIRHP